MASTVISSSSTTGNLSTSVTTLLYSVVYTLNEKRKSLAVRETKDMVWIYFLLLLDFVSILQLLLDQVVEGSPTFSPLGFILDTEDPTFFYTLYGFTLLVTLYVILTTVYMGVSFRMSYFITYVPAHILRAIMGTVVTA